MGQHDLPAHMPPWELIKKRIEAGDAVPLVVRAMADELAEITLAPGEQIEPMHKTCPQCGCDLLAHEAAFSTAVETGEQHTVDAEFSENFIRNRAGSAQRSAAAGFAEHGFTGDLLGRARLFLVLLDIRTKRLILGFKISALALKCRVFGLSESDALSEDRRRAMLVDQFLEKIKHRKFSVR